MMVLVMMMVTVMVMKTDLFSAYHMLGTLNVLCIYQLTFNSTIL